MSRNQLERPRTDYYWQILHLLRFNRHSWTFLEVVIMGEAGIEPTTPGLEGRCSIQLSYSPAVAALRGVASLIVMAAAARKIASQALRAARVSAPQPAV